MGTWNIHLEAPLQECEQRAALLARIGQAGGHVAFVGTHIAWITVEMERNPAEVLAGMRGIVDLETDGACMQATTVAADRDLNWAATMVDAAMAHEVTRGAGATITVLDTGLGQHPDLDGARIMVGPDMVPNERGQDLHGHGTAIMGLLVAQGRDYIGIAPEANIMMVKVLDRHGKGLWSWIAAGIEKALDANSDVVVMALGGHEHSLMVADAMRALASSGAIAVVAAGNDGSRQLDFPGASPFAITVAAVDRNGRVPRFSSWAPWPEGPDVAAPGVQVQTLARHGGYSTMSGTSLACAVAGGCLALLYSVERSIRSLHNTTPGKDVAVVEVRRRLRDLSIPLAGPNRAGYGLINANNLVRDRRMR